MKKFVLSLVALGALSGAAFAAADDFDNEGLAAQYAEGGVNGGGSVTKQLAVTDESGMTTFQKVILSGKGDGSDR